MNINCQVRKRSVVGTIRLLRANVVKISRHIPVVQEAVTTGVDQDVADTSVAMNDSGLCASIFVSCELTV